MAYTQQENPAIGKEKACSWQNGVVFFIQFLFTFEAVQTVWLTILDSILLFKIETGLLGEKI